MDFSEKTPFPEVGNASLFTKVLFTKFVPLNPPLPTSKVMDFLLILLKGPQAKLRTLSQNCEQTPQKSRTNRVMNKRALLILLTVDNFSFFNLQLELFCLQFWLLCLQLELSCLRWENASNKGLKGL